MKILLAYSSLTGNTKKLCDGVYDGLKHKYDIDICKVKEVSDISGYDTIMAGYWVDKGTANKEAKKFIKGIKNKKVVLLGTLGAAPDSEHGMKVMKNVAKLVDESNEYYNSFLCRGKVSEKLTKRVKFLPLPKSIRDQMYEASINSHEPREQDIKNAINFVDNILSK